MIQPSIAELSKLIGFLYDGHIEEDPYSAFLGETRRIIDSNFASITMREPQGDDGGLLFVSCEALPKTFVDDHDNPYTDRYYTSNLMTNLPWGKVVSLDECVPYRTLERTELYKYCMAPIDIYHMIGVDLRNANGLRFSVRFCRPKTAENFGPLERTELYKYCMAPIDIYHMIGVDLRNANGLRFSVRFCRPKTAENFGPAEREFLEMLASHIQRAVANGMQLIQLDKERKLYSSTIAKQSVGVVTLDERGKIVSRNAVADQLIRDKDGLSVVNEQLHLESPSSRSKLNGFIEDIVVAQRNQEPAPTNALSVERPSGKADLEILLKPMMIDKTVEPGHTPHMIVFINEPERSFQIETRILMSLYGLTKAEVALSKLLAEGANLDQAAAELGIARNTARAQLRSIFAKTGVSRQSMLVSLLLKSVVTYS